MSAAPLTGVPVSYRRRPLAWMRGPLPPAQGVGCGRGQMVERGTSAIRCGDRACVRVDRFDEELRRLSKEEVYAENRRKVRRRRTRMNGSRKPPGRPARV